MRPAAPLAALILAASIGCDRGGAGVGTAGTASAPPPPPPPPSSAAVAPPPPPTPPSLDHAALRDALRCQRGGPEGPCRVVTDLARCAPWEPKTPSGDGRWFGEGFEVEGREVTTRYPIVISRASSLAEVGPGAIPTKIALTSIPREEVVPHTHAPRFVSALRRGKGAPPYNDAEAYVKKLTPPAGYLATRTSGPLLYIVDEKGSYACQREADRAVLLVRPAGAAAQPGDGLYAELWMVGW